MTKEEKPSSQQFPIRETIDLGHHAQSVGVDAALVVNDFYSPLSRAKLAGFYRDVAASVDLPLFLYNFPAMTGQDLEPSLVRELALSCENIVGIKDTIDAVAHTRQIILEIHKYIHSGFFLGLSLQREPHLAPRQPTIRTRREQRQSLNASVTAQHARSATDSSRPRVGRRADLFHEGGRRDYVACRVRNAATRTTRQRVVRPKGGKTFFLTPHLRIQMPVHNRLTAGNLWPIAAMLPRARASTVRRTRYWAREQQSLCERLYGHSTPAKGQA